MAEAGVPAISGTAFRMYAESSGSSGQRGSIQTAIAITNAASSPATVSLELTRLDGSPLGTTASLNVTASGQSAKFLSELFPALPNPFQGLVRITTSSSGIAVAGLRGRYNERGDFLITNTTPVNEATAPTITETLFPHFTDSRGYSTQFILFNSTPASSSGSLRLVSQNGQTLNLLLR